MKVGFRGLGGLYRTVVAVRGDEVDEKPAVGSGAAAKNAVLSPEPIAKKGPEIHGPPGAAAISCRALARWPSKLQFGGLG